MSINIDKAFVKQFEREVHEAYQRMGSKLRQTVRTKSDVTGATTVFQTVGKGVASTKSRNGSVPVMNVDHGQVECQLLDFYAGDWVDRLDELKTNIDERQVLANAGAYALGRKTDELIIDALNTNATPIGVDTDGMTLAKVLQAFETMGDKDVPDDGQRYAVIGWKQWSDLLQIDQFASADYVGEDELPYHGTQAKRWLGTLWLPHSGLPVDSANDNRICFWFHKSAIGHASGSDVQTDITWHGDRAASFINNMMSQGAAQIDADGIVAITCDEA